MSKLALAVLVILIAGCTTRSPAPVDDRRPPAAATAKPPAVQPAARAAGYIVKRGDTLYSVALEHGVDYRDVARWNQLDDAS